VAGMFVSLLARSRKRLAVALLVPGVILGAGLIVLGASASGGSSGNGTSGHHEQIVVCESNVTTHGGIDTSSAVATRVPAGTPIPPGCHAR
jgi:hypothetical protein